MKMKGSKPTYKISIMFVMILLLSCTPLISQENKQIIKDIERSQDLLSKAGDELKKENFPLAEADYRKAIALDPKTETGKYNLGTAYYNKEMNEVAMKRFKQAAAVATEKNKKHKAFHNLGNTFMNAKSYKEAVEAYKNALRNDPTDDETRYNLALAKKMLEEEQKNGGDDGDDKNKDDKENKDDKNKQENQDKKEEQKNKKNEDKKEGDEGDEKEEKDQGKEKEDKKEGDQNEDKGNPKDPKEEEMKQQQPVPGKLSTQQIKNLLDAMNNEEKKVQDKINAKKQKGAKIKSKKDW